MENNTIITESETILIQEALDDMLNLGCITSFDIDIADNEVLLNTNRLFNIGYSLIYDKELGRPKMMRNEDLVYSDNRICLYMGNRVPITTLVDYKLLQIKSTTFSPEL